MKRTLQQEFMGEDLLLWKGKRLIATRQDGKWLTLVPGLVLSENIGEGSVTVHWRKPTEQMLSDIRQAVARLLIGKSAKQADRLMKGLGYRKMPPASLGE